MKGETYDLGKLIVSPQLGPNYVGGSMVIVRLAPQDYHRFHSPVTGQVSFITQSAGTIYSVNGKHSKE